MNNEKKFFWKDWIFYIAFFSAGIIKNIVCGIVGFDYNMFKNQFNILYFLADTLLYVICFHIVYFSIESIKSRRVR